MSAGKRCRWRLHPRERSISMKLVEKIQAALEAPGIEFTNGKKLGVRLKG